MISGFETAKSARTTLMAKTKKKAAERNVGYILNLQEWKDCERFKGSKDAGHAVKGRDGERKYGDALEDKVHPNITKFITSTPPCAAAHLAFPASLSNWLARYTIVYPTPCYSFACGLSLYVASIVLFEILRRDISTNGNKALKKMLPWTP